jgi:hypothetical protein
MGRFSTDAECIAQMQFVNASKWIAAGYTGKGQTVFLDDVVNNPGHIATSKDVIQSLLPDIRILSGRINFASKSNVITSVSVLCVETGEQLPFDEFVTKYNVGLINNSTDGGNGTEVLPHALWMRDKIKQYNLIVTGAAGNGYGQPTTQRFNGACIIVTSCTLKNGRPADAKKACGPNLDFAIFSGYQSGTSHSAPFLLALTAMLRSKWPGITQDEAYQYLKSHCLNLGDKNKFGWGVPIMGEPNEKKEETVKEVKWEKIEALRGTIKVEVDGVEKEVVSILYKDENHIRTRDYEDILNVVDVEYDSSRKMPIIKD